MLSFFGRIEEGLPKIGHFHADSITFPHERSLVQNSSNLKGLERKEDWELVVRDMGLWLELKAGI